MGANDKTYIVDASVIAKWFLNEEGASSANQLKADFLQSKINLLVPSHFESEMASIFGWKFASGAVNAYSLLKLLRIPQQQISVELFSSAINLCGKKTKISVYDAIYHALALQEGAEFITADKKYYKLAKKHGNIRLLKDYLPE